jgi:hypothetical protein
MTTASVDAAELDRLRSLLADRLDERPFETWSPCLLRAIITVLELVDPDPKIPEPDQRVHLQLVKGVHDRGRPVQR